MDSLVPADLVGTTTLPDDRQLAWSQWGPLDGQPVIFCTGAGMSGSLGFGAEALAELGLRLIAVDRPGLSRSSPCPGKTLETWVADVRHLIEQHKLDRVTTVGFSQGAPFALALGGAGVARAVAVVAGQDDLATVTHLLSEDVAGMVRAAQQDPARFERRFTELATADGLWEMVIGMSSERDRAYYTESGFGSAYRRALTEGFSQGAGGYARDLAIVIRPWPIPVEQVTVPVDLWYGGLDTSPVHSPDFGETLVNRLPNARRHLLPAEGSSLLWTQARQILATLQQRAAEHG
ncbi:alpha/beta hydrolase [Micromonospora polyrhachis]|uniref:Pimeloyl-ACP methyl ester carboxylesterase n=1 Tax=Micromonospora polyrhachis TaxID=1282883 RepID=A0A7W7WQC6_9ACTN|nr:alpha/beta hydrolase [Micromonospora polyrhachis]MBB4959689.1 pimeloyl-ACP methyl ester carboxylesterase [Micromonospora polyrhachis]